MWLAIAAAVVLGGAQIRGVGFQRRWLSSNRPVCDEQIEAR